MRSSLLDRAASAGFALLVSGAAAGAFASPAAHATADHLVGPTTDQVVHVDNPFLGVTGYVNPEWKARVEEVPGGSKVSNNPTSVWIDRVALAVGSLDSRRGLRGHLEAALAQGAGYVQVVLDNLPGKECDRGWYSSDEFALDELDRYQHAFIDPIVAIEADARYQSLRIVNLVEPRWVQNLVLHTGERYDATEQCDEAAESGNYVAGVRYALTRLRQAGPNVYTYLDAGSYDQLGWYDAFGSALRLITDTVRGTAAGLDSVDGFATNIGGYAPITEPYFTIDTKVNGTSVKQSKWVDWNDYVDELPYALRMRTRLVAEGFNSSIGMIIDTSRNGWGGNNRPTRPGWSSELNRFVDDSRIDRRLETRNWCNQGGAGLGERPVAAPRAGIDAFAWIKVPGESDGVSTRPSSGTLSGDFDFMCDPTYNGARSSIHPTGALANAPARSHWFPEAFNGLLKNAYPPLP